MDLKTIKETLEATGMPVAYSHFVESENSPLPAPPFIAYLVTGSENLKADNKVYKKVEVVQIELYTDSKDITAESKVEEALNSIDLPFDSTEIYISSEQLFQKIYEVRMI
jgi:hypothetical protein